MFYILYQVTNNLNGKIYVGVHKTKKLDDGYMGSGKVINSAIKKNGIENFTRVILEQFDDSAAMYAREKEVVTDEFLARDDTYNLRRGGSGGFDYINKHNLGYTFLNDDAQYKKSAGTKQCRRTKFGYSESEIAGFNKHSEILKEKYAIGLTVSVFRELNKDVEFIAKRTARRRELGVQRGEKNSQFGMIHISDPNTGQSTTIPKTDEIPLGWVTGRNKRYSYCKWCQQKFIGRRKCCSDICSKASQKIKKRNN